MNLYKKIIELGIEPIYTYVMDTNIAKYLPYHNNFHLENVCKYALLNAEGRVSFEEQRLLAVAALFHDYNHTGSSKNDNENIEIAVREFNIFIKNFLFIPESDINTIIQIIKGTRYPYLTDGSELPEIGKMLRDADLLQGLFCENYINGVVRAIATESGIPIENMLKGQIDFLTNSTYLTTYATSMAYLKTPELIELLKNIISMYKIKK